MTEGEANNRPSASIDWSGVRNVLVVRLRSIGDTVLATPTLQALRDFLPESRIDILLDDWVAPLLEGHPAVNNVIALPSDRKGRLKTAAGLRKAAYDVAINLHGGTTSTFLTRATGAGHRIGYSEYQFSFFYTSTLTSSAEFWGRQGTHSAEQQLALAGFAGVPVGHLPPSSLPINEQADESIRTRLAELEPAAGQETRLALVHPVASTFTKQWETRKFADVAKHLFEKGLFPVAVGSPGELSVLDDFKSSCRVPSAAFSELSLPEITALARRSSIFVGNDSGVAHIAAAVGTPPVVIFGSSNRLHWRPWTRGPAKIVFREFECQPCPGSECRAFGSPRCILEVPVSAVTEAVDAILSDS